jgi:hypothetical protein
LGVIRLLVVVAVVIHSVVSEVYSDIPWAEQEEEVEIDDVKVMTLPIHLSKYSYRSFSLININYQIRVTLEQLYKGDTRSLEISRKVICQTCNG